MKHLNARYFKKEENLNLRCELCPHNCFIKPGETGICRVRCNIRGELFTENYGLATAIAFDPVEKKPLYHFHPGSEVLSIGTPGCNLRCFFCQNCSISQEGAEAFKGTKYTSAADLLGLALSRRNNIGIAFTYNEPVVYFEYMLDVAKLFKEHSLKTVMVSNAYINRRPLADLLKYIDAFNFDLKSFNDDFYKKHTKASLKPVLDTINRVSESGKHIEITFLLIPGLNDDVSEFRLMLAWIKNYVGKHCVLHISRYYPSFMSDIPPTPVLRLKEFHKIAREYLDFVYLGNIIDQDGRDTLCPVCGETCIRRNYRNVVNYLSVGGNCSECGLHIIDK